jgi:hypothetical protein
MSADVGPGCDLYFDPRDDRHHEARGSQILYWLDDLGGRPLTEATADRPGFLFAGARPIADYDRLVAPYPLLRDRPAEREPLLRLDITLAALAAAGCRVPTPRTWRLELDRPPPPDLRFPLFLRTAVSSWKVGGGHLSRVTNARELADESAALRRVLGWDAVILAREWLDLAPAGSGRYGPVPQELRVWIVDGRPRAWSFHHLHMVRDPTGFPPAPADLLFLKALAAEVGRAFRSRLVVADFARTTAGPWWLIEAGPGSCAGTAHEDVFKAVATALTGEQPPAAFGDAYGGPLPDDPAGGPRRSAGCPASPG